MQGGSYTNDPSGKNDGRDGLRGLGPGRNGEMRML